MIHSTAQNLSPSWQLQLKQAITSIEELCGILQLDIHQVPFNQTKAFPLKVPRAFVDRMERGNARDPLLLQILPQAEEWEHFPGYTEDPLGECAANPVSGLLHKYQSRALLVVTGACSLHCRFCFRRHFPYEDNNPGELGWQKAIDYIAEDASITEVILSGGDPLVASDALLARLATRLCKVPHVKRLRIHSRMPVIVPARVTTEFMDWFAGSRLQPVLVLHVNHANEIDASVVQACKALRARGVTLLNQTVLLKGINDNVETLAQLSERLLEAGILPYYLHMLDKVKGAAHFNVEESEAVEIMHQLRNSLSGFLVPRLVREIPGALSKMPINI